MLHNALTEEERFVFHLHYKGWPDFGIPNDTKAFISMIREANKSQGGPIVVHCSAGLGRTGVFITVQSALALHEAGYEVDLMRIATTIRKQRDGMIQTADQFKFCYQAVADALS